MATVFAAPTTVFGYCAIAVAALMLALWALSLALRDASIVDPAWGPMFGVIALVAAFTGTGDGVRRWLLAALTVVWGVRLGAYLVTRKLSEPGEDRRYTQMRERHPHDFALWSLVVVFLLQGLLALVISLPITTAADRPGPVTVAVLPGVLLFAVGLAFEAIGDAQLRRFKRDPANRGKVMDRGLWRYTRHPNYFGDACVWWGIWLIVLAAGGTWWTAIGPALMTTLLVRVSGKALLEKDIGKRRPGYADYVARTSGFLPLPPRRESR